MLLTSFPPEPVFLADLLLADPFAFIPLLPSFSALCRYQIPFHFHQPKPSVASSKKVKCSHFPGLRHIYNISIFLTWRDWFRSQNHWGFWIVTKQEGTRRVISCDVTVSKYFSLRLALCQVRLMFGRPFPPCLVQQSYNNGIRMVSWYRSTVFQPDPCASDVVLRCLQVERTRHSYTSLSALSF
jgi:hypothetical protein